MMHYLSSLFKFKKQNINISKGTRQGLLMLIPLLIGYLTGYFQYGLLAATGTLTNIYVFGGSNKSKLRILWWCTIGFTLCIMLGTITVSIPLLFGLILLIVTVVTYYIFSALEIPGPSATFFIVTFALPINMPIAPDEALVRGFFVFLGGLFTITVVTILLKSQKKNTQERAIEGEYQSLLQLFKDFSDKEKFKQTAEKLVGQFKATDKQLITSFTSSKKQSEQLQRLYLLHNNAEGIFAELLELNTKEIETLPDVLIDMMEYIERSVFSTIDESTTLQWKETVDIPVIFQRLEKQIYRTDEILHSPTGQIEYEAHLRQPLYGKQLKYNLTLDSLVFMNTMRYLIIMGTAVFIALMFDFDKAYWIPLTAHTILIGTHTIHSMERAVARTIGTFVGVLLLTLILMLHPPMVISILVLALSATLTEIIIGANYAVAMIFITTQVIMLNGLASGKLSILIALPRVVDVIIGVIIAVIGLLILGRKNASQTLPGAIAEVVRYEMSFFYYVFSKNNYLSNNEPKYSELKLSIKLSNMNSMYNNAHGELFADSTKISAYYPIIFALEEISFMLSRAQNNPNPQTIDDVVMGQYLIVFEDIAAHFEKHVPIYQGTGLPSLPQYVNIRTALLNIQQYARLKSNETVEQPN
ncbi:FUSC family protein [Staphylococcus simulans]